MGKQQQLNHKVPTMTITASEIWAIKACAGGRERWPPVPPFNQQAGLPSAVSAASPRPHLQTQATVLFQFLSEEERARRRWATPRTQTQTLSYDVQTPQGLCVGWPWDTQYVFPSTQQVFSFCLKD